jgi:hypothetical protein
MLLLFHYEVGYIYIRKSFFFEINTYANLKKFVWALQEHLGILLALLQFRGLIPRHVKIVLSTPLVIRETYGFDD